LSQTNNYKTVSKRT